MNSKPRTCPACKHNFIPWAIWKITRWSTLKCPNCSVLLTRNFLDLQCVLLIAFSILAVIACIPMLGYFSLELSWAYLVLIPAFLIDILTVRLQLAGEFRGILGYKM